jgi:hypothetical protein
MKCEPVSGCDAVLPQQQGHKELQGLCITPPHPLSSVFNASYPIFSKSSFFST